MGLIPDWNDCYPLEASIPPVIKFNKNVI